MGNSETILVEVRIEKPWPSPLSLPGHSAKSKPLENSMETAGGWLVFSAIHMRKRPKKAPSHTFLSGHRRH